jgi:mRNA interferase MazF|tara:strand:+ start:2183 stop:2530 length:348 start_codon:yes stop_codon:yes gene_type:complete
MYDQGDIVLLPFPYSDLTGSKQRPALIISNEKFNKTNDRICCLITRNSYLGDAEIKEIHYTERKLPFKSFIRTYRIFTVDKSVIKRKLCKISLNLHNEVISKINVFIDTEKHNNL